MSRKFRNIPKSDLDEEYMGRDIRILCTESFMLSFSTESRTSSKPASSIQ